MNVAEIVEQLAEAIETKWGEPCDEHNSFCQCCIMWSSFQAICTGFGLDGDAEDDEEATHAH